MNVELVSIARRSGAGAPMEEVASAAIRPESGVEGDVKQAPSTRLVTVLSRESWHHACTELGAELSWLTRRANLLIRGFEFLPTDVGRTLHIGDVILEITRETDPCERMEQAHPGLRDALTPSWRGGVCCRVVRGGEVAAGDEVKLGPEQF